MVYRHNFVNFKAIEDFKCFSSNTYLSNISGATVKVRNNNVLTGSSNSVRWFSGFKAMFYSASTLYHVFVCVCFFFRNATGLNKDNDKQYIKLSVQQAKDYQRDAC